MIYLKNLATGKYLSSQKDGSLEIRDERDAWELFEIRSESGGALTLTCPAHTHGRIYRLTIPAMSVSRPMEGEPSIYTPFVLAE